MILYIVIALVVIAFVAYAYCGGFTKIKIEQKDLPREVLIYTEVKGAYKQTPKYTDEIYYTLLNEFAIDTYKGAGIFYDNPKQVATDELRSEVGCILEEKDYLRISEISSKYKIKSIDAGKYNVVEFPQNGVVSVFIGLMRVYPLINKHREKSNTVTPIIEIYDVPNKKTIYKYPIKD